MVVVDTDTDTDTTIAGVAEGAAAPLAEDAKALFRLYVRGAAAFGARVVVVVVDHVVVGGAAVVMMGVNIKRQVIVHPCEVESG